MKKALLITLAFIIAVAVGFLYWTRVTAKFEEKSPNISDKLRRIVLPSPPSSPPPVYTCPIDGLRTSVEASKRRPLAIMVENHVKARPQSGLSQACLVYETVAEGGITRFMAIYVHEDAEIVGPVRSARDYFVSLARQYDALYAHAGGSPGGYKAIKMLGLADLDQFSNTAAYWRTKRRRAPHNLYTSTARLRRQAALRNYALETVYEAIGHKKEAPAGERPAKFSLEINFSRFSYRVKWVYDPNSNSYTRYIAGKPDIDAATKQLIKAKNIVVQYTSINVIDRAGRVHLDLLGEGKAIIFQDGRVIPARWQRLTFSELTRFYNTEGQEIKFNPGQTWIEIVDPRRTVKY
jgi:hypothetical protein